MVLSNQKPSFDQGDPPRSPRETLPTMYDLPSESLEDSGLPDEFHDLQPQLLSRTLRLSGYTRDNYFTASDLNLYYDVNHPRWYKRPDWFLAVDVPRLYEGTELRRSYVIWQEGKSPYVVIEFLSPGTEAEDLGRFFTEATESSASTPMPGRIQRDETSPPSKLEVYERYLRVPHYFVYSRYTHQLRYFKLDGGLYQEQVFELSGAIAWLSDLEIGLGIWDGVFEGVRGRWLRWCDRHGNWFLTDTEASQEQVLQAARNLLATGMEMERVIELLGLSDEQRQMI